jgi:NhaA family Na+:H+ antiporter
MTAKAPASDEFDNRGLYGGIVLGLAAIAALIIANSPLGPQYETLLRTTGEVRIGSIGLSKTVDHWINDGLMAVFFLLVGLEIKREALEGPLSSAKQAALPVIAAFGGFVTPAAIFAAVNWGDAHALRGWAIPAATDIAFALGVCAMLGRKVPASLKIFLMALAIIDDLMAIIVIAIFYTADLSVLALALGGLGVAALAVLNLLDVRRPSFYLIAGLFTWVCVLKSGVHATLAGVAVGLAMPLTRHDGHSLLEDTEHALRPWVIFAIVPIFAFANAGVSLHGLTLSKLAEPIPLGIIAGLFIGKQLGVFVASLLAISWAWRRCRKERQRQSSMPWPS